MNQKTVIKWLSWALVFFLLVAIQQCAQSNNSINKSLISRARADLADSLRIEAQENRDSVRVVYNQLKEELNNKKSEFDSVLVHSERESRKARELAVALTEEIERSAGDSTATIVLLDQLVEVHEAEVSALESANEALLDERAILYQRIDVADNLLSAQLELTQLAETSIASYQASANEAIQAMNKRVKRDRFIQGFLVVATAIAVLR